jgi:hypothetical protein
MKIQEASKEFTEGGIMFPSSKTSTLKKTPKKAKKTGISASEHTPKINALKR